MNTLELRPLREEDEQSFRKAVESFGDNPHLQFAFYFNPAADFSQYVKLLNDWSQGRCLPEKFVPSSFYVGVVDGEIVGRLSVRHRLNDFLEGIGGHIGYGVIPSRRNCGYATEMLKQALPVCARLGMDRVLVTCDVDNIGSRKVIEKCGGIYEGDTTCPELTVQKRRYWICPSHHLKAAE